MTPGGALLEVGHEPTGLDGPGEMVAGGSVAVPAHVRSQVRIVPQPFDCVCYGGDILEGDHDACAMLLEDLATSVDRGRDHRDATSHVFEYLGRL